MRNAPPAVAYAVAISRRLEEGLGSRSKAGVAREANLERSTLYDLLAGRTWPDAITIAQLEQVLETRLWPDHPVTPLTVDPVVGEREPRKVTRSADEDAT